MSDEINFQPWMQRSNTGKIIISKINTIVDPIELPKFEINQQNKIIQKKYNFIDIERLLKLNNKKGYSVAELREIAEKLKIQGNPKKLELVRLIKLKIGLE